MLRYFSLISCCQQDERPVVHYRSSPPTIRSTPDHAHMASRPEKSRSLSSPKRKRGDQPVPCSPSMSPPLPHNVIDPEGCPFPATKASVSEQELDTDGGQANFTGQMRALDLLDRFTTSLLPKKDGHARKRIAQHRRDHDHNSNGRSRESHVQITQVRTPGAMQQGSALDSSSINAQAALRPPSNSILI